MQRAGKVLLCVSLLTVSGVIYAQNNAPASPPRNVGAPMPTTLVPAGTPTLMLDQASNTYLPWLGQNLQSLVNYADFFYQQEMNSLNGASPTYMPNVTISANVQLAAAMLNTTSSAVTLTAWDVQAMLPYASPNPLPATLSKLPATDTTPYSGTPSKTNPNNNNPNNAFLNGDTILGVTGFQPNSPAATTIQEFIQFLTGQGQTPAGLTFSSDPTTLNIQMQSSDVQQYLLESRTVTAAQSVGMSNIHYLAQERAIVPDLGKNAGMTTLPLDNSSPQAINDASQLQLEQFLVDRRVGNPAWYAAVNTESPIAVQRETLFVLAEISKEIFQQRLIMERMLAEEVAMQQLAAQINQAKILFDQQQVQQGLSSTPVGSTSTSGGGSTSYTSGGGTSSSGGTTYSGGSTSTGGSTSKGGSGSTSQTSQLYQQTLQGLS